MHKLINPLVPSVQKIKIRNFTLNPLLVVEFVKKMVYLGASGTNGLNQFENLGAKNGAGNEWVNLPTLTFAQPKGEGVHQESVGQLWSRSAQCAQGQLL